MTDQARVQRLLKEMAHLADQYQAYEEQLAAREVALEERLNASEIFFAQQLEQIRNSIEEFRLIMSEEGERQWRFIAEEAEKEGKAHLESLQQISANTLQALREGGGRLEQTIVQMPEHFTGAVQSLPVEEFKRVIEEGTEQIKATAKTNIHQITTIVRWFHWKNIIMMLVVALFVGFLTGFYDSAQWPWEIHQRAAKERMAGRALIVAWPYLTPAERSDIINASNKKAVVN